MPCRPDQSQYIGYIHNLINRGTISDGNQDLFNNFNYNKSKLWSNGLHARAPAVENICIVDINLLGFKCGNLTFCPKLR